MKKALRILLAAIMTLSSAIAADSGIHAITIQDIQGKEKSLKDYAGKVMLIVNVASECGYTPQYEGLQALHEKYAAQGLIVLGVPCNDFGGQEPGAEPQIIAFCTERYKVTFPMTAKVAILGASKHPLYTALTQTGGDVGWNFEKFLVGKDGKVLQRFGSDVEPTAPELTTAIDAALK